MKASIPGVAFDALAESGFPQDHADLWRRVEANAVSGPKGRVSVVLNLTAPDFMVVRGRLNKIMTNLSNKSYEERGMEGNITMQSIGIALGRIDDALSGY